MEITVHHKYFHEDENVFLKELFETHLQTSIFEDYLHFIHMFYKDVFTISFFLIVLLQSSKIKGSTAIAYR